MKKFAVIVAGGSGLRMGSDTPKQFLLLNNKPILQYTIESFFAAFDDVKIVLVLPQSHMFLGENLKNLFAEKALNIEIVAGGATRFHSVQNGLKLVEHDAVVFVHDGVRSLLSADLITRCYHQAIELGSAIPVVTATDSIRILNNLHHTSIDRNTVKFVQTPQTFLSSVLLKAFAQPYNESFTDEATVVEAIGEQVRLIEGEYNNIKITRPIDLIIAQQILNERRQ